MMAIRKLLFDNFGLKVISLLVAVLLWGQMSRDPMAEIQVSVPIEFHNAPDTLEMSTENVPQAQVRIRGPVRELRDLSPSEVRATIDLTGAGPRERTFDLRPASVHLPDALEVLQVIPAQVRLTFDRRGTRQIRVQPRVIGQFATGYRIAAGGVKVEPATVTISGPQRRVEAIEEAVTDPVDASGVVGRATFTTQAYVADPLVRITDPTPIRVTVVTEKTR